jgi:predicted nucleotidyltransferase
MADIAPVEQILSPVTAWARSRSDILALAIVGSWARGTAQPGSDIDLVLLVPEPLSFRYDEQWLGEIAWRDARIAQWHDADYGKVWSRHVQLEPPCEIEFTFCAPSWAAIDPLDATTTGVVSGGCRVLLDKSRLFEKLLTVLAP